MASIIEQRRALHSNLKHHRNQNSNLKLQISQLQALANIGTTTSMIAHEINNLLTPLSSYAELALNYPDDDKLTQKALQKTAKNCQRVSKMMQSMLSMVSGEAKEKQNTDLRELVDEIFSCLCRDFAKDGITVKIEIPENLEVWAVPVQVQQVLMNLILNARDAMLGGGGVLSITARAEKIGCHIVISDTGQGIAEENFDQIFDLFFTTKKSKDNKESGSGLGLAFCKKAVEEHGGKIEVRSNIGEGTEFSIFLPGV